MPHRTHIEEFTAEANRPRSDAPAGSHDPAGDLALATRLRDTAPIAAADPGFAAALRADLLARMRGNPTGTGDAAVRYAPLDAPFGRIFIAYRDGAVLAAGMARDAAAFERSVALDVGARPRADEAPPEPLRRRVLDHLEGRRRFSGVDLSRLRPFQRRVLEKITEIPRGEVRPYSWVAREIGAPGAVRAVGTALGHNPVPFIIPCHRVVRADGSLGEYSGGGPEVKVRVLSSEGVPQDVLGEGAGKRLAPYRASHTTHIFCYPTCRAARRIRPDNAVDFGSPAAAVAAGYRACRLCRPS